jgi:hypothetical protein
LTAQSKKNVASLDIELTNEVRNLLPLLRDNLTLWTAGNFEMPKDKNNIQNAAYVKLNVGGKKFYTSKSTITSQDTMLSAMFSERWNRDKDGYVFIDRNGKYFDEILNFLRDGKISRPKTSEELENIKREADFYCISGL